MKIILLMSTLLASTNIADNETQVRLETTDVFATQAECVEQKNYLDVFYNKKEAPKYGNLKLEFKCVSYKEQIIEENKCLDNAYCVYTNKVGIK